MDETLLRMARSGDAYAFEQWISPYENGLYRFCLQMLRNHEDTDECIQDTMMKAFLKIDTFRADAKPSTWLYRIAYRVCIDMIRKRKPSVSLDERTDYGIAIESRVTGPYEALEKAERYRLLITAIHSLPDVYRAALSLQLQGLEYDEIARVTNVPVGTVKSRVHRARDMIKKYVYEDRELFNDYNVQTDERGRKNV